VIRGDSGFKDLQAETHPLTCEGWGSLSQGLDSAIIHSGAWVDSLFRSAELEGDVDYGFEFYWLALARGGVEDPTGQGFHGILV